MKLLIIGSGGREHALAWKLAQSPRVTEIFVAPGNGGTDNPAQKMFNVKAPSATLLDFVIEKQIDLTVVGPEVPLADGIVDQFQARGLSIWGPSQAAAQIEASKAFSKAFMARHNIPTAEYATFDQFDEAQVYLQQKMQAGEAVVIKASGLAAGKGVILPDSLAEAEDALRDMMVNQRFGGAGAQVVIEERMSGPELSVLAFCDGKNFVLMPPAQDHKRAHEGDQGPNTGGMGAYAPAPLGTPDLIEEIARTTIAPTLAGLRAEGIPFVGVLYAGLMITEHGPKLLEFNCRFGDPETQVILPLLETDLLTILEHSVAGTLDRLEVQWRTGAAATVVLASGGYPGSYAKGLPIYGVDDANCLENITVFQAGTRRTEAGPLVTNGGRVLNVTAIGTDFDDAFARAYHAVERIKFADRFYRRDIGWRVRA